MIQTKVCPICKITFNKTPNISQWYWENKRTFCSSKCNWVGNKDKFKLFIKGSKLSPERLAKVTAMNRAMAKNGPDHWNWQGGITDSPGYRLKKQREWSAKNRDKIRVMHHNRRIATSDMKIQDVQRVYEENIKCFGTLTCIYCLDPIIFGHDTLEHIIPLTRGGDSSYENLAVACNRCNCSKGNRLIAEWTEV